jgi:hypothetical protein
MSETPRCTSWLGHKFEGRYSKVRLGDIELSVAAGITPALVDALTDKTTYERDICTRCGVTVEKATKAAE